MQNKTWIKIFEKKLNNRANSKTQLKNSNHKNYNMEIWNNIIGIWNNISR